MSAADTDLGALAGDLVRLTGEMVEAAKRHDWQAVAFAEAERRRINARLFASPIPPAHQQAVADAIQRVLAFDPELHRLVDAGRDDAAVEAHDATANRKAVQAYHRYSTD